MTDQLPKPDVSNLYPKIVNIEPETRQQPKKSGVKQIFLRLTFVVLIFIAGFGSGFQQTHQWLAQNGLLNQGPNSGNNCGV